MGRLIVLVLVIGALAGGAYVFFFKKSEAARTVKGYKKADSPQVAADMLKKAIAAREYDMAAFYCTANYAEQLNRGAEAGSKLGAAIDNLNYQLKERSMARDEVKNVMYILDPFPKELQITVSKEAGDTAEATIVFSGPAMTGNTRNAGTWVLEPKSFLPFVLTLKYNQAGNTTVVPMKKENGEWKFDFPTDPSLQTRVGYMNDKYKLYVAALEKVTQEVKNEPETRENVTNRLKSILESTAKE